MRPTSSTGPTRVVVIGAGMAATRLVEGLLSRGAANGADLAITVLGDEPVAPYNRILLSAVLEGTHRPEALALRDPSWWAEHGVDLRLDSRAAQIHRTEREVEVVDGTRVGYDVLVLATGSVPSLPPIRGLVRLDGQLHPAVHAFRSQSDMTRLGSVVDAAANRRIRRAVVVGGGLLGLQVARALAVRGLLTEVVEGADHLLHSQVGPAAAKILARDLARLGTEIYTGARAVRLRDLPPGVDRETGSSGGGAVGLSLDNGYELETDLVVLTAGGRPSTALARRAQLTCRRGVVVDTTLTTSDPAIHAIGDCAQLVVGEHSRTTGFVAPAWEQADVLAERLAGGAGHTGGGPTYDGSRLVARLRAADLDVAVLGERDADQQPGAEVVEVSNPIAGSHRRLVVQDGVIIAATLVGDLSRVGLITAHHDRGTRLATSEPGALLLAPRPAGQSGLAVGASMPDTAEVCACAGVSAVAIRACGSLEQVRDTTRASTGCGGCADLVRQLLATRPSRDIDLDTDMQGARS